MDIQNGFTVSGYSMKVSLNLLSADCVKYAMEQIEKDRPEPGHVYYEDIHGYWTTRPYKPNNQWGRTPTDWRIAIQDTFRYNRTTNDLFLEHKYSRLAWPEDLKCPVDTYYLHRRLPWPTWII